MPKLQISTYRGDFYHGTTGTESTYHYLSHFLFPDDLPFENPTRDLITWRDAVLPSIIDWAGTLDEPFAINSHPDFPDIVEECWKEEFPEIPADEAVYAVVSHFDLFTGSNSHSIDYNITLRRVPQSATGEVPLGSMLLRDSQNICQ